MHRPRPAEPELARPIDRALDQPGPDGTRGGLCRRLFAWRKAWLLRRALRQAGEPSLLLDLSHEAGMFWPLLAEYANRVILAAAAERDALSAVLAAQPAELAARVKICEGRGEAIPLHDNAVDCIFAMGLLQRVADPQQRLAILRELHRVSRDTLIVSLQLEGNYPLRRQPKPNLISRGTIEEEIGRTGFEIVGRYGVWPGHSTAWIYVLRKED